MMIVLAITIMQLVIRFMRVATSELLSDVSPVFRNPHVGTFVASVLGIILVLTGWWQYLWVLFGGANQLMASLALMLVTAWLMSEGKPACLDLLSDDLHVRHDHCGASLHLLQPAQEGLYRSGER